MTIADQSNEPFGNGGSDNQVDVPLLFTARAAALTAFEEDGLRLKKERRFIMADTFLDITVKGLWGKDQLLVGERDDGNDFSVVVRRFWIDHEKEQGKKEFSIPTVQMLELSATLDEDSLKSLRNRAIESARLIPLKESQRFLDATSIYVSSVVAGVSQSWSCSVYGFESNDRHQAVIFGILAELEEDTGVKLWNTAWRGILPKREGSEEQSKEKNTSDR